MMVAALAAECLLRVAELSVASEEKSLHDPILDSRLDLRLRPNVGGHDALGFRNRTVPKKADVVSIGDSQTYGINVNRDFAWPQTLARMTGLTVYNMGLGYYGTAQYWALTEDALRLDPETLVVGLYLGNDLYGAYLTVYKNETYAQFRDPNFPVELRIDSVGRRANSLYEEEHDFQARYQMATTAGWLRSSSALVRLLYSRGIWPEVRYEAARAWAGEHPDHGLAYENGQVRTVLTTEYRLLGMDLREPRIAEGLRLTCEILEDIQRKAEGARVRLLLLIIPTKESVYARSVAELGITSSQHFSDLVEMEGKIRNNIIATCEERGIEFVNALDELQQAVDENEQIYPVNTQSHPNANGYARVAMVVSEALRTAKNPRP